MTDQNTFTEVLREVAEIVRTAETPMSEEDIMSYFSDMDLSLGQKKLILDYLNKIDYDDNLDIVNDNVEAGNGKTETVDASKNSKVLQAYMEDISLLQTYSEEEVMALYKRLFAGEEEVIETITTVWLKKVVEIVEKYKDLHTKAEDLIQEGNMALLMRLNQWCGTPDCSDAEKNFKEIEERLARSIEKGIMDYISEWDSEKQHENSLIGKISLVHEALKYLEAENGMPPTLEQLSDFTKLSCEELTAIKEFIEKES